MAGIKSDIMNKNVPVQNLREFEVGEPSFEEDPAIAAVIEQYKARGMELDPNVIKALRAKQALQQPQYQSAPPAQKMSFTSTDLDWEKDFAEARKIKVNPRKGRLSDAAKRRIELLSGLKKNTRDCTIGDYSYTLQILKNNELREAILAASFYDGTIELPFETRKQILARSLTHVGGTDIEMFLGDSSMETKLEFLDELDERISDKLYSNYLSLVNETNEKYSVKTEAEAQEVAADLKK